MKLEGSTLDKKTRWYLFLIAAGIIALLLGIEYISLVSASRSQAYQTATVLIDQVKNVLTNNERKEQALVDSLKEEYITKAKAVSYIIDNNPGTETDIAELIRIATLMSIDEIHIFDETGTIYGGTVPPYYGFNFDSGEQMAFFKPMLGNKALSMCQDVTPNTAEGKAMMYAICWNDAGTRMLQVGIEPRRLLEELRSNEISEVIEGMPAYDGIDILVAERESEEIVGATTSKRIGGSLSSIGVDLGGKDLSEISHFQAVVSREPAYCSASEMGSHVIVIVQESAMVNRAIPMIMLTVFLYLLLAAVVIVFIVRRMTLRVLEEQRNANTDPMTGFYNRRAYENDVAALGEAPYEQDLVYVSLDLNGLKRTNDTFGHEAGDALIRGGTECMRQCFGHYGKLYRIGGDEFVALIRCTSAQMAELDQQLARLTQAWSTKNDRQLSLACGVVRAEEFPQQPAVELAKTADTRMYEAKANFYQASDTDRRRRDRA